MKFKKEKPCSNDLMNDVIAFRDLRIHAIFRKCLTAMSLIAFGKSVELKNICDV